MSPPSGMLAPVSPGKFEVCKKRYSFPYLIIRGVTSTIITPNIAPIQKIGVFDNDSGRENRTQTCHPCADLPCTMCTVFHLLCHR